MSGDKTRSKLTDAELKALGVEIPEEETDASLFDWIDKMIQDTFKDAQEARGE